MGKIRASSGKFLESNARVPEPFAQVFSQMRKILLKKNMAFLGILQVAPRVNRCFWAVMRDFARAKRINVKIGKAKMRKKW